MKDPFSHLIEILESARRRKEMYFRPISPESAQHWIAGLRSGASVAGLDWSLACRRPALQSRGLETLAKWETDQLRERGLSDEGIVDELLAIEIEMWSNAQAEQKR